MEMLIYQKLSVHDSAHIFVSKINQWSHVRVDFKFSVMEYRYFKNITYFNKS